MRSNWEIFQPCLRLCKYIILKNNPPKRMETSADVINPHLYIKRQNRVRLIIRKIKCKISVSGKRNIFQQSLYRSKWIWLYYGWATTILTEWSATCVPEAKKKKLQSFINISHNLAGKVIKADETMTSMLRYKWKLINCSVIFFVESDHNQHHTFTTRTEMRDL